MKNLWRDFTTKASLLKVAVPFVALLTHIQLKPHWGYAWYEPATLWSFILVALMIWLSVTILKHVQAMDNDWLNKFLLIDEVTNDVE